jgi:serine/threonine protein phosphatase PrpC
MQMPNRSSPTEKQFPLCVAAASWTGLVRANNEDAASVNGERVTRLSEKRHTGPRHCFLLADGMGGNVGGEVASDLAVGFLEGQADGLIDAQSSAKLLQATNQALYEAVERDPGLSGMGTTIAGVVARATEITWFNVGDSRVYLLNRSGLRRLSEDHAIGSSLTQCLGGSFYPISPARGVEPWAPGDRVLLCSDGLTDLVADPELEEVLRSEGDETRAVKSLLRLTLARGAHDNVTVVLATNDSDPLDRPRP